MKENTQIGQHATRASLGFIVLFFAIYGLIVAKPLLLPLVIAIVFWYLINALAKRYGRLFGGILPRFLCFLGALATLFAGIWLVVELISSNIADVVQAAPSYQHNLEVLFEQVMSVLHLEDKEVIPQLSSYFDIGHLLTSFAKVFTGIAGKTIIVFVYVAFLLYEQRTFDTKIKAMVADVKREKKVRAILKNIDEKIQLYLWVKTLMSALTGALSFFVMKIVGVDFAAFWALIIFFLNFIPTIGSLLGIVFPALLTLIQFDTYTPFIVVSLGLSAVQMGIGNFLDPRMMGESLNLSPLVIILSLATWGTIWGIPGMFLSIPIMVIVTILLAQFPSTRAVAVLLSKSGKIPEIC